MSELLEIEHLTVEYRNHGRLLRAVDDVTLAVGAGESIGIVGESGCGKSSLARAVAGLEPIAAGRVRFEAQDLASLDAAGWRNHRRKVQLVFQDSLGALNPRMTTFQALDEVLRVQFREDLPSPALRRIRVVELLDQVELSSLLSDRYPHELSGGQRQRVALARALAVRPTLVIADEPVSALDVAVQAQIIQLLDRLRKSLGIAFLMIAHDLAIVRALCSRAHVLHRGKVVESGSTAKLFTSPEADYTRRLLAAVPDVSRALAEREAVQRPESSCLRERHPESVPL